MIGRVICIFSICLFVVLLLKFEFREMENRALFIAEQVDEYVYINGKIPSRLDDVSPIFVSTRDSESYCTMFSSNIDGIGECFYSPNKDHYIILIYGFFIGSGYYSSKIKSFVNGSGLN